MTSKSMENSGGISQVVSKIGIKLPMIMSFLVIATILVIVTSNSLLNERVIARAAGERLESISVLKTKRVKTLLETIDRDLRLRAADPGIRTALIAFTDGYQSLENPTDVLKRVYITENEHPLGQKDMLVSADTGSSYGFIHSVYHPALDHLQDEMGYYDVFLIDAEGDLVYSVFKENDYATNMIDGPWKDSGLADAFRGAMLSDAADSAVFIDFAPYEPSNFAPAAFISRPIFDDEGNRLGALVYQMPIDQLSKSINDLEGLGDTADGFLVGSDLLMRTDSLLSDEDDVLQTTQDIVAVHNALAGEHGLIDYVSPSGRDVLAFYRPIEFLGISWVSIVQQDKAVLFSGLPWALKRLAAIALTTALIIMAISIFFSRSISLPIQKLTGAVRQIAGGTYDVDVPEMGRSDELGELARATNVFKQNSIEMAKLNEEQEAASKKMATMAEEQELARQREAVMAKEKEELDRKTAETREAMLVDLGKSFGTVVEAAVGGEFSKRVEAKFSDAVLNELAEGVNKLLSTVDQGLSETGQVLARISSGDLTEHMEGDFRGAFGQLQGNVNNMMDALKVLITEISGSGNTLASSSAELRDTAGILSSQAEQNAASLEETSSALDQLSESVRQVSINVSDASKNAQTARDTAQSSEKVAADAATSMVSITEASQEIGRVIGVIEDIAFQINLLALNAGVEAARAGSAGRGFSVVASEVRQLAQRASDASKEIATVITTSDAAVSEGVRKVAGAQESLEEIAKSVINISVGVEKVSTAISEQVAVINEITSAVGQIDQNTQKQAASLEEVTGASGLLANEADGLRQSTARFDTGENRNVESIQQRARAS